MNYYKKPYLVAVPERVQKILTVETADVLHSDLGVSPHGRYDGIQRLATKPPRRDPQVPSIGAERQGALIHV